MFKEAGIIVSRMETPESTISSLLKRLKENLSAVEKDEVRDELKKEMSTALEAGGIPLKLRDRMVMVFVNLLMECIMLGHAETGSSIILYLKCGSVESLLSLKELILSGLLLRLLSQVIKEFTESRRQIQLVVKAEDYNLTLTYLNRVAGKLVNHLSFHYKHFLD